MADLIWILIGSMLSFMVIECTLIMKMINKSYNDQKIPSLSSTPIVVDSLLECAMHCLYEDCCAVSYEQSSNKCVIFDVVDCNSKNEYAEGWQTLRIKLATKQFFSQKLSWNDAKDFCTSWGGRLASVSSRFEHEYMMANISSASLKQCVWIGGSDIDEEGIWKWVDQSRPMTRVYWNDRTYQPSGNRRENCLCYYKFGGSDIIGWNDSICYLQKSFICEK